jgi:methylated-DNA-[protein]-cysteine S-methyltransferase
MRHNPQQFPLSISDPGPPTGKEIGVQLSLKQKCSHDRLASQKQGGDRFVSQMKAGWSVHKSPLGPLTVIASAGGISAVRFPDDSPRPRSDCLPMPSVAEQLAEYFAAARQSFELPLDLTGTPFELAVWRRLQRIPFGETISYGELAEGIDRSLYPPGLQDHELARVVGAAVGRTPTPILVPCHRVIGADGSLVGYGGGLDRKRALLELERGVTSLLA